MSAESSNPPPAPASPVSASSVRHISGWRRLLALPLAVFIRLWGMSLRFELDEASRAAYSRTDKPIAFILWHNRLFLVAEIARRFRKGRPVYGLVSASKDGAWLETFFELMGIKAVRGSSSRLGREAASALVDVLKQGHDIGVTPDGPRGPCYDFKAGAVVVARRGHAQILLVGGSFSHAWHLRSWDRFILPLPFSKVKLRGLEISEQESLGDRTTLVASLATSLRRINPD